MRDTHLEEKIAHLERLVEDLSEVVARQDRALTIMTRRVEMLLEREAARETEGSGSLPIADRLPPHY